MTSSYAHARYRELLYPHGHGYPFWVPEPSDALPDELKAEGVRIGDVGILTDDGGFQYLWNAHLPANHSHNLKAPPNFEPLPQLDNFSIRKIDEYHSKNAVISSNSTRKRTVGVGGELEPPIIGNLVGGGASFDFSTESKTGAILTLPQGGARVDALTLDVYLKYAIKHAESWYRYINQQLQFGVKSGALYLVTGTNKCSSWGVASFSKPSGSHGITLKFTFSGAASSNVSVQNSLSVDYGVEQRINVVEPPQLNQCVFSRGFAITVRDNWLYRLLGKSVAIRACDGTDSSLPSSQSSRPFTGSTADAPLVLVVPQSNQQSNPAAAIGEVLLNKNDDASFAIVHDEDWIVPMQRGELPQTSDLESSLLESITVYAASLSNTRVVNGVCILDAEGTSPYNAVGVADDIPTPHDADAVPFWSRESHGRVQGDTVETTSLYGRPSFVSSTRTYGIEEDSGLQTQNLLQDRSAVESVRRLHTIRAETFDGMPFTISIDGDAIGHGPSANIYKGQIQDQGEAWVVAVKDLGHVQDTFHEQLLVRELRAARAVALRHPLILAFLGTARIEHHQAVVSLYMKNGNLMEYLKLYPAADKKKLILQVADAVNYLHTVEGLAHGDLKCANILISDFGDALLADFGLGTLSEKTVPRIATALLTMNTVPFTAPELLLQAPDEMASGPSKSRESDVYAFGMLILEAVTGLVPFAGLSFMAVVLRIGSGSLPTRPIAISSAWWEVCRSCWTFNPSARPRMELVLESLRKSRLLPNREISLSDRGRVGSVAYMPCGRRVVSCSMEAIEILDITTGQSLTIDDHPPFKSVAAVSPKGAQISSSAREYTVQRWDALSGDRIDQPMRGHTDDIRCIAYSPDGTRIVSASEDRTIRLWDASTGDAIGYSLKGQQGWRSVAFSPDGSRIVSASDDHTIRIWDSGSGQHLATLLGHSSSVTSVCYLPNGRFVVSGSWDCTVRMWNAETLQLVHTMQGHSELAKVFSVAVSPSGKYIASGSADATIRLWDAVTGEPVGEPLTGHTDYVRSVAFSPDGKSLVSGSDDGTVRIWELFE